MRAETLRALGLNLEDMDAKILLDEGFNGTEYGLTKAGTRRLALLRDIITEYREDLSKDLTGPVTNSKEAVRLVEMSLRGLDHEELWVAFLNRRNNPIDVCRMSTGGFSSTAIDVKMIIRRALTLKANGFILYHNHPSGDPTPGTEDLKATEKIKNAADLLELTLLDHIVVTDTRWYSFAEEGSFGFNK